MGWLIALGILVLLGCIPLGIRVKYDADGFTADLLTGPVRMRLYPREKAQKPKKEKQEEKSTGTKPPAQPQKKGGSFSKFMPYVKIATEFLGDLRRKLRIKKLKIHLCMAGDDPCDLAVNYARAWAAVGNILPQLERLFVIKKRDIRVLCDFTAEQTTILFRADITITVARALGLCLRYGWRVCMQYLKTMNKTEGGATK